MVICDKAFKRSYWNIRDSVMSGICFSVLLGRRKCPGRNINKTRLAMSQQLDVGCMGIHYTILSLVHVQNFHKKKYFWKYATEYISGGWEDWSCWSQLLFWKYLLSLGIKYLTRVFVQDVHLTIQSRDFWSIKENLVSLKEQDFFQASIFQIKEITQNCTSMTLSHVTLSLSQYNPGTLTTGLLKCAKLICT